MTQKVPGSNPGSATLAELGFELGNIFLKSDTQVHLQVSRLV